MPEKRISDRQAAESAGDGLAIFVGGLRWFGVRWGLRRAPAGLRLAGFAGRVIYWNWHSGREGFFWLPMYLDRRRFEREAQRLAAYINGRRHDHPRAKLYLLGCSAGGYVALRALELLADDVSVDAVALLSAAFDPHRDLKPALAHVAGPLVNASSRLDCLVLGLGTALLGTCDGAHTPAAGQIGLRPGDVSDGKVVEISWRPNMIGAGRFGGHSSCTPRKFIADYIAPAMGLDRRPPVE